MRAGMYSISPAHYNDIPDALLQGDKTILEFGCATGINQIISKHRDFFLQNDREGRYLGVDLEPYDEHYLTIEQGDIRHFQTDKTFDVVLALHVLEHIELKHWPRVFDRLMGWVAPDGVLIVGMPNNEPDNSDEYHMVFGITSTMLQHYMPDAEIHEIATPFKFSEDGAPFLWALLRYIKRYVTGHPYVRQSARLLAIWRNGRR